MLLPCCVGLSWLKSHTYVVKVGLKQVKRRRHKVPLGWFRLCMMHVCAHGCVHDGGVHCGSQLSDIQTKYR